MGKKLLKTGHIYPGEGYYYVLCDICGTKIRAKEAILITDKYSDKANLLVCKADADKTNPQARIRARKDRIIDDSKFIRSEPVDSTNFTSDAEDIDNGGSSSIGTRTPSTPRS